jgi:hypothetical protein
MRKIYPCEICIINFKLNLQEDFKQGLKDAVAIKSVSSAKEDRESVIAMVDSVAAVCD